MLISETKKNRKFKRESYVYICYHLIKNRLSLTPCMVDRVKQKTRCLLWFALICESAVHLYCFHENDGRAFSISNKSENPVSNIRV